MSRIHAFIDTMLFLHFRQLDEVDWLDLLGADEVELLVAPVVWRQLDRHKDRHSVAGLRDRAKTSVRRLRGWLGPSASGSVRPGVTVRLHHADPKINFAERGLSRDVEDDQLVATVIEYQQSVAEPAVLVTDDYLLATKARALHLQVVEPRESDRLPEASSEDELRIKKLEAENQRLRGRRANLVVTLDSGEKHKEVRLPPLGELTADEKQRRLAQVKAKYPPRVIPEDRPPSRDRDPGRMAFAGLERPGSIQEPGMPGIPP
jgi:predicted ribonuclease YlaK